MDERAAGRGEGRGKGRMEKGWKREEVGE